MRKLWVITIGIISLGLIVFSISFGNDNCARRPSIAPDLVGTMEIMLHVVNVQRIGQWSKPVVEMLLSDSEGKKTGSDFKGRYKEIPFSKYEPGYDDNSNIFYYLVTTIESDDVYHLQVFSKDSVSYALGISIGGYNGDGKSKTKEFDNVKIKKGETHHYTIKLSNTAPMEIKRVN
jgi:hypothetical protein